MNDDAATQVSAEAQKGWVRYSPLIWISISALITVEDHFTDPYIQFPVLFLIPIAMATIYNGLRWGLAFSIFLPLIRLFFEYDANQAAEFQEVLNTGIDIVVFVGATVLFNTISIQRRALATEVSVLRGLLPICSHCKRIRTEQNDWEQLEKYITEHSQARFSHSLCPQCVETHYPGIGQKLSKKQ